MNRFSMNRMTLTIASSVLALCGGIAVAQEAAAVKPLRLSDLATTSNSTTPQAGISDTTSSDTTSSGQPGMTGDGLESSTATAASAGTVSRWSSRPLPGGDTDIAPQTQAGQVDGTGAQDVVQVGGGLAGVLLLIWVLRTLIRKSAKSGAARGLLARVRAPEGVASIMARYPVARGEHVVLLEVGRRILVVHQASGSMTTLSELTDRDEVADIRARINGEEREKAEEAFAPALEASLESKSDAGVLEPVDGMPGFVAETVDLTTRSKRSRLTGGAA